MSITVNDLIRVLELVLGFEPEDVDQVNGVFPWICVFSLRCNPVCIRTINQGKIIIPAIVSQSTIAVEKSLPKRTTPSQPLPKDISTPIIRSKNRHLLGELRRDIGCKRAA